jgi:hypothetical protein
VADVAIAPFHAVILHVLQNRVRVERVIEVDVQIDPSLADDLREASLLPLLIPPW